jgi:hypothetical protein
MSRVAPFRTMSLQSLLRSGIPVLAVGSVAPSGSGNGGVKKHQ